MTDNNHPITPPDELVKKWTQTDEDGRFDKFYKRICTQAARWGADQELEACCEWLDQNTGRWDLLAEIRAARRPKPPSLKEQALKELHHLVERLPEGTLFSDAAIHRAIESLPD